MSSKRIIVAIDGPAGAGKSTLAKRLANRLGFVYINTGAMYRAVALWALRLNVQLNDMHRLEQLAREAQIEFVANSDRVLLNHEDVTEALRAPEVSAAASKVSAIRGVRQALLVHQRAIAENTSVVMEGRDIGSVVFPDAQVKVFLDAKPEERASRRTKEMVERGERADEASVAAAIRERDRQDRTRKEAPLLQAPDAQFVDTTGLPADVVEELVLRLVREKTSNGKEAHR